MSRLQDEIRRLGALQRRLGPERVAAIERNINKPSTKAALRRAAWHERADSGRWSSSDVQTLLFPRDRFTAQQARAWARRHGFAWHSTDATDHYIRLRQRDPSEFAELRTIDFGRSGIKAVLGDPRR